MPSGVLVCSAAWSHAYSRMRRPYSVEAVCRKQVGVVGRRERRGCRGVDAAKHSWAGDGCSVAPAPIIRLPPPNCRPHTTDPSHLHAEQALHALSVEVALQPGNQAAAHLRQRALAHAGTGHGGQRAATGRGDMVGGR